MMFSTSELRFDVVHSGDLALFTCRDGDLPGRTQTEAKELAVEPGGSESSGRALGSLEPEIGGVSGS